MAQVAFIQAKVPRLAWVAGHSVGKSYASALLIAWYMLTRPGCRCIVTSATYERQVGRVIFAKLRTLVGARGLPLQVGVTRAQVVAITSAGQLRLVTEEDGGAIAEFEPWRESTSEFGRFSRYLQGEPANRVARTRE